MTTEAAHEAMIEAILKQALDRHREYVTIQVYRSSPFATYLISHPVRRPWWRKLMGLPSRRQQFRWRARGD